MVSVLQSGTSTKLDVCWIWGSSPGALDLSSGLEVSIFLHADVFRMSAPVKPGLQYTRACLQYTRRTTSHHAAPWRAVLRSTARINSHQFAPIEQCSIFCARPRDFAAARLRLQAKLGLFNVLGQKGLSKTLVQTNGFCYPSSSSFFCTSFVVFLVKTALLFFK